MPKRILHLTNGYPPAIKGGAEIACQHRVMRDRDEGAFVAVITSANDTRTRTRIHRAGGALVVRLRVTYPYAPFEHGRQAGWKKLLWHAIDHVNVWNALKVYIILRRLHIEEVVFHNIQGLGYPIFAAVALSRVKKRQLILHDYGLLCVKQSLFKSGRQCTERCALCIVSGQLKSMYLVEFKRWHITGPSRYLTNLHNRVSPALGVQYEPLVLRYQSRARERTRRNTQVLRLGYFGQISEAKGVGFLLRVLSVFAGRHSFSIDIYGRGPAEADLKNEIGRQEWLRWRGFVPAGDVGAAMMNVDVVCVPSLWPENSPLVAHQALSCGCFLAVSNQGGLPEFAGISDHVYVAAAGDTEEWIGVFNEIRTKIISDENSAS